MGLSAARSGPRRGARFAAGFDGFCGECGELFAAGEPVGYPRDGPNIMHAECADLVDDENE